MLDTGGDKEARDDGEGSSGEGSSSEVSASSSEGDDSSHDNEEDSSSETSEAEIVPQVKAERARRRPVWTDPSISSLTISLAGPGMKGSDGSKIGNSKLRKLREEEGETQITGEEYELRLRKLFEKMHPRPSWASVSLRKFDSNGVPEDIKNSGREKLSHLLNRDSGLVERVTKQQRKRSGLLKGRLDVERLRNANEQQGRSTYSPIENVAFHPTKRAHVMLTTTKDRRLRLFQIDGKTNPLLETIHIPDLPMKSALFHPSGSSVLLSGPRPYFYSHDLDSGKTTRSTPWRGYGSSAHGSEERDLSTVCFQGSSEDHSRSLLAIGGRRGAIHLLEWGSVGGSGGGSLVGSLHMNAPLAGISWHPNVSHSLISLSTLGTIHSWDTRNMKCELQRSDAGLYAPKMIEGSSNGDWWAVGSESGIVNMYDSDVIDVSKAGTTMQAQRTIKNVVTTTTSLRFNHSSEILAIASDKKKDALKVVHIPSMTVFENWPTAGTPLGRITSLDFSNSSEYLAIGNSRGKVLLYSLRHYT